MSRRMRGQPLVVLGALLLGWTGARVSSMGTPGGPSLPETVLTVGTATAAQAAPQQGAVGYLGPQSHPYPHPYPSAAVGPMVAPMPIQFVPVWYGGGMPTRPGMGMPVAQADPPSRFAGDIPQDGSIAAMERTAVLPAGLQPLYQPVERSHYGEAGTLLGNQIGRLIGNPRRWSMDVWALLRKDAGVAPGAGTLPATYGGSQAGAVLRYRLALENPRKPTAYLRTTSTVGSLHETSVALGLSARPLAALPVVAAVEGRLTDQGGLRRVQPAVMAVSELPPLALPGSLRAEAYAQAGYVGGRFATPFADAQLRVDRSVATLGRAEARIGAGAWGGIQKGASRLDAGPGATVSMPLSPKIFGRLAVDYRIRVGGNAEPDSGPAVTVAAGF